MKESNFFSTMAGEKIRCELCEHRCKIALNEKAFCKIRLNIDGKLFTLNYGNLSAVERRPIEIKPFYHYYPGSSALTFSTWSCNFACPWCQNYHLSRRAPIPEIDRYTSPEDIINLTILRGDHGLCGSFQEPILLTEWTLDTFNMAKTRNLYCCYVSNGYITKQALGALINAGLSAMKMDVKGDKEVYKKYCGGVREEYVWRNIYRSIKLGLHVEVVNLLVTCINDDECSIQTVIDNHIKFGGTSIPLHFTRYFPAYKYDKPPTDLRILENAHKIAKMFGIEYVYLGNVPDVRYQYTYCPECCSVIIKRSPNFGILKKNISKDHKCSKCGKRIPITGHIVA